MKQVGNDYTTIFHFCTYSGEIIDMLSDLTKTLMLFFGGHCLREVFQTLHDNNIAWGLAVHNCDLIQGHRYVRIINCKLFLDSSPL